MLGEAEKRERERELISNPHIEYISEIIQQTDISIVVLVFNLLYYYLYATTVYVRTVGCYKRSEYNYCEIDQGLLSI